METGGQSLSHLLVQRWACVGAQYETIACLALATYEWTLSFAEEVELIYKKRWTWFKALYLACRYYPFVALLFTVIIWVGRHTRDMCLLLLRYHLATLVMVQVFPYVILLVRCYVFLGRRRWFLIFSITAMSLCFIGQVVGIIGANYIADNQFKFTGRYGCFQDWQGAKRPEARFLGLSVILPIIIDMVSIIAILCHHRKTREVQSPLSKLFVQQAVLYFSVVLALSLLGGGLQMSGIPQLDGRVLIVLLTLPNLMACRLILQLREKAATPTPSEAGHQLSLVVRRGLHSERSPSTAYHHNIPDFPVEL